jgi:hypothetical protein
MVPQPLLHGSVTPGVWLLQAPLHWTVPQPLLHAPPTLAVVLLQAPLHWMVPQPLLHACPRFDGVGTEHALQAPATQVWLPLH